MERNFRIYLTLIFLLLPIGQLARVEIAPAIHLHLLDLALGLGTCIFLPGMIRSRPSVLLMPLAFLFPFHLSLLLNPLGLTSSQQLYSYLYTLRLIVFVFFIQCIRHFVHYPTIPRHIQKGLSYALITTSALGLLQYLIFPDLRPLAPLGWDPHLFRAVGTFLDPGFLGLFVLLGMAHFVISPLSSGQSRQSYMPLLLPLLVLCLTYSRATYLAYAVAVIVISRVKKSWKFLISSLTLFATILVLLPRPTSIGTDLRRSDSIHARIENWRHSLTIIRQYPLWGVGYNTYRFAQLKFGFLTPIQTNTSHSASGADSSLLFTLATIGMIGTSITVVMLARSLIPSGPNRKSQIFALLVPATVHSFFLNSLYYPWIVVLMALAIVPLLTTSHPVPRHPSD